jgi:hypothetical protein
MPSEFQDISIIELSDDESGPSGQGALMRIVLKLSAYAPPEWADYFHSAWRQHMYMMKRSVEIQGNRLVIICMPEELQTDHIPELNKVMSETNAAYKKYAAEKDKAQQARAENARRQKEELAKIKGQLKF